MKEVECITRIFKLTNCRDDLVDFMIEERMLTESDLINLRIDKNQSKFLYDFLKKAERNGKLVLLSFDWVLLPLERIRIRLITDRNSKEFTYQY